MGLSDTAKSRQICLILVLYDKVKYINTCFSWEITDEPHKYAISYIDRVCICSYTDGVIHQGYSHRYVIKKKLIVPKLASIS